MPPHTTASACAPYYLSVPLVLWLFGPVWMLVATLGMLAVLRHLDHLPQQD